MELGTLSLIRAPQILVGSTTYKSMVLPAQPVHQAVWICLEGNVDSTQYSWEGNIFYYVMPSTLTYAGKIGIKSN